MEVYIISQITSAISRFYVLKLHVYDACLWCMFTVCLLRADSNSRKNYGMATLQNIYIYIYIKIWRKNLILILLNVMINHT